MEGQDSEEQDILAILDIWVIQDLEEETLTHSVGTFRGYQEVGGQECMDRYLQGVPILLQGMECPMDMPDIPIRSIELIRR